MSRISSNTLFNFTDTFNRLIDNLHNGIFCNNTYEELPLKNNGYKVPMACFCDIPLSLIKEHFEWYGRYGIGINRSYARELGVQPVWYITSENNLAKKLVESQKLSDYERRELLPYLKKFMGNQEFNNGIQKRKKFYDEREWRYIPKKAIVEPLFGIKKANIDNSEDKNRFDRMRLLMQAVEYIIIDKESELDKLAIELNKLSASSGVNYEWLLSKVITARRIENDF